METLRVAKSLDDLKVGMVVAWQTDRGRVTGGTIARFDDDGGPIMVEGAWPPALATIVILSDPPSAPVSVPAHLIDALREAVQEVLGCSLVMYDENVMRFDTQMRIAESHVVDAARALLAAAGPNTEAGL